MSERHSTLRVAIVDDEPPARRKIRRMLERARDVEIVGEAGSGEAAIPMLAAARPDLLFLDIQMPDMDGFALLGRIERPAGMQIVFVTAFDQHALRAFEVHALDYLLKPVSPSRFEETLERVRRQMGAAAERTDADRLSALLAQWQQPKVYPRRVGLNTGDRMVFVECEEIRFAEAARNYVLVHAGRETHQIRGTLDAFAAALDPDQFPRINRSQMVNMNHVRELRPWFHGDYRAVLADGTELNWSRRYAPRSRSARSKSL